MGMSGRGGGERGQTVGWEGERVGMDRGSGVGGERVGIYRGSGVGGERVGIYRGSGVTGVEEEGEVWKGRSGRGGGELGQTGGVGWEWGESWDRQEWGTRGGVGWEGKRVGIDRRGSVVGVGESGDRQEEGRGGMRRD